MKKGFTLIELLAVIVILAIIALIATPIILGIINDAREQAKHRTAELIAKEIEFAYTSYLFNVNGVGDADSFCTYMTNDYFAMDNGSIEGTCTSNTVTVKSGSDNYTVTYTNGEAKVLYGEEEYAKVTLKSSSGNYVYMWYTGEDVEGPSLDEIINLSDYSKTVPSDKIAYLKFKLDKTNKVTEGYACAVFNETTYCVQGWNPDYYGSYTGMSTTLLDEVTNLNPTGNVAIINSIKKANPSYECYFGSDGSYCSGGSVNLSASSNGDVYAYDDGGTCGVIDGGSSGCVSG